MPFQNPATNIVIPTGAVAGQTRIVIGPDLPPPLSTYLFYGSHPAVAAIIFYSDAAGSDTYQFTAIVPIGGSHYLIQGFVTSGVVQELASHNNFPTGVSYEHNGAGNIGVDFNFDTIHMGHTTGGFTIGDATSGRITLAASTSGVFAPHDGVYAEDPNNPNFMENWHTLSLQNGWAGTFKYRKDAAANTTKIRYVGTPGTKADGTQVGVMPAGYRPSGAAQDLPLTTNVISGGQAPHVNIATNGIITCWGVGAGASNAQVMGTIEQDW